MDIRLLEPGILYVSLPPEPQLHPELVLLRRRLSEDGEMHVILDFSRVEIITSPSIGALLLLQRQLSQRGWKLVLCSVRPATTCIFRVAGLDLLLELAADKSEALAVVHRSQSDLGLET
jgi:anti-anti-sigma factor